uniref:Uncharacterized protein n=1 Tax=Anguilla anguilla TaxID=7936 RepID=A0A0E9U922_ANGAN
MGLPVLSFVVFYFHQEEITQIK